MEYHPPGLVLGCVMSVVSAAVWGIIVGLPAGESLSAAFDLPRCRGTLTCDSTPASERPMDQISDEPSQKRGRQRGWTRRLPIGAEVLPSGGVHFRVWAPRQRTVEVVLQAGPGAGRAFRLARGRRILLRHGPRGRRGDPLCLPSRRPRRPCPARSRVAIPARGAARSIRGRRSLDRDLDGSRPARCTLDRGPGPLRAARRHVHARGHVGRGPRAAPAPGRTRASRCWR